MDFSIKNLLPLFALRNAYVANAPISVGVIRVEGHRQMGAVKVRSPLFGICVDDNFEGFSRLNVTDLPLTNPEVRDVYLNRLALIPSSIQKTQVLMSARGVALDLEALSVLASFERNEIK